MDTKPLVFTEAIPNVTLYGGIVVIMMCAIGSGYDVMNMYSKVYIQKQFHGLQCFLGDWAQVWIITRIAGIIIIASIVIMMLGGIEYTSKHIQKKVEVHG